MEVVKLLIDAGAKVNVPNERGVPPFLLTEFDAELVTHDVNCLTRYEECVEVFLSAGADVNLVHPVTGEGHCLVDRKNTANLLNGIFLH